MTVGERMFARVLLFLVAAPLVDLLLLVRVGARIGPLTALAVIGFTGMLGVWVARTQGLKSLLRVVQSLQEGRLPQKEVMEGFLTLAAGVALVSPGFLGDGLGLLLLIPFCRNWARRQLEGYFAQRGAWKHQGAQASRGASPGEEVIIDAEVIRTEPKRKGTE